MTVKTITVENVLQQIADDVLNGGGKKVDPLNKSFGAKFDSAVLYDRYNLKPVKPDELEKLDTIECKLIEYIQNEGIEFMLIPDDRSEVFVCTKKGYKAIYICPKDYKNSANDRLLAIAHEIGHYLDLKHNYNFNVDKFSETAYTHDELIKAEVIAWANAKVILEALGYNDWTAYVNETIRALNTYIGETNKTIDHMKKTGEYLASRVAMMNKEKGE